MKKYIYILVFLLLITVLINYSAKAEDILSSYPEFFDNLDEDLSNINDGLTIKTTKFYYDDSVIDKDNSIKFPFIVYLGEVSYGVGQENAPYIINPTQDSTMVVIYNEDGSIKTKYKLSDLLEVPKDKIGFDNFMYLPIELSPGETVRYRSLSDITDYGIYYGTSYSSDNELFGSFTGGQAEGFTRDYGWYDSYLNNVRIISDINGNKYRLISTGYSHISAANGSLTRLLPSGILLRKGHYYEENENIVIKPEHLFNTLQFKKVDADTNETLYNWEFELKDLQGNLIKKVSDDASLDLYCTFIISNDFMKYGNVKDVYCYNENGEKVTLLSSSGPIWTDGDNDLKNILKFQETKAPDSYILNDTEMTVSTRVYINQSMDAIEYSIDNEDIAFGSSDGTIVVKNKKENQIETINISGKKTWDDNNNQDGKRPNSITVNLLKNGEKIDSKTVTSSNNWQYEFTDLVKYDDNDNEIDYTISEDAVEGYEVSYDGFNIINKHEPETVRIKGKKIWDDNNNQDGKRPNSITVNLLADGVEVDEKQVRSIGDTWEYEFKNVPKYDKNDKEIIYTITEDAVEGYEVSYDGFNIINKHEPETVRIKGKKVWYDFDNKYGTRPESITVILWRRYKSSSQSNFEPLKKVVTAADNWEYDFGELPKYIDGKEMYYNISEQLDLKPYETSEDGALREYSPIPWFMYGNYWDLGRYDIANLLRSRTKDITVKKTNIDGNPLPNTKFDIYAYAHVGTMLGLNGLVDLMDVSPLPTEHLTNTKYNLFPIGGYGFGIFLQMSSPFPSEFVRRVFRSYANDIAGDLVYIYTPLLKFKNGTTLLDYFNENGKMPGTGEYTVDDIDYEATEWYALNLELLPDLIELESYDYIGLYNNDIWTYIRWIQDGNTTEQLDEVISESKLLQIKDLFEKMSMGQVWLSGSPTNMDVLSETMKFKVGEFITDENGEIVLEDVWWMNRTAFTKDGHIEIYDRINPILEIVETETADDKYILDDTVYTLNLKTESEITIVNKEKIQYGYLQLKKTVAPQYEGLINRRVVDN